MGLVIRAYQAKQTPMSHAQRVRGRNPIGMNRSLVGIPFLDHRNPHCNEYPLIHEILVWIPDSGDTGPWGFKSMLIPGTYPYN